MNKVKWFLLQLFAGEGGGGTGASGDGGGEGTATGAESATPGQQRLLELGVPASKIRKNRAYSTKSEATQAHEVQEEEVKQAAAVEEGTEEAHPKSEDPTKRMSWDEIIADPEYNKRVQETIRSRLRTAKDAEENLSKLTPALELLARKYGQDPAKIDYGQLAQAISGDESFYEDMALEMGTDVNTARKLDEEKREKERNERIQEQTLEEQKIQNHLRSLEQQGEAMKKLFPQFDLMTELKNPAFARMTSPSGGLSVEAAYHAIHYKEIQEHSMRVAAQEAAKKVSNSIQSAQRRPTESGTSGQAPSVATFDYRNASREQREAFKKRILAEAAQGRKVYPGQ